MNDVWAGLWRPEADEKPKVRRYAQTDEVLLNPHATRVPLKLQIGHTIGKWTLEEYAPGVHKKGAQRREAYFRCRCDCGTVRWVRATNLGAGKSQSCGCQPNSRYTYEEETQE